MIYAHQAVDRNGFIHHFGVPIAVMCTGGIPTLKPWPTQQQARTRRKVARYLAIDDSEIGHPTGEA